MTSWRLPAGVRLRVPLRLRVLFRGVFALLALALLALALSVLRDEKQRSHRVYAEGLAKSQAQIAARLRHPTGQLALLNPGAADRPAQPLRPLVLPYRALDFSDRLKAQQAVEMAGCALQYPDGATLCAAVGNSPYGGAFVYLVASLAAGELVPHASGDLLMDGVHRAVVDLSWRDSTQRWTAPYELDARGNGRLTGYAGDAPVAFGAKAVRDFEGWLWQEGRCLDAQATLPACARRSFVSLRLPVEVFRDALRVPNPVWPPPDLDRMALRLRLLGPNLGPGSNVVLFDSDRPGATLPFSMQELRTLLLPGEKLTVQRVGAPAPLFTLTGANLSDEPIAPWIAQLIRRLPVDGFDAPLQAQDQVDTALGRFRPEPGRRHPLGEPGAGRGGHPPGLDRGRHAAGGVGHLGRDRTLRHPPHHAADANAPRRCRAACAAMPALDTLGPVGPARRRRTGRAGAGPEGPAAARER